MEINASSALRLMDQRLKMV